MFATLVVLIIISAGSIFSASFYNRKYEEIIPLSIFTIVMIIYSFGLAGFMKAGVYAVIFIAVVLYVLAIFRAIKSKQVKQLMANVFTPAFLVFCLLYFIVILANYNRRVCNWDEFSHWADIVKVMFTINDFGTSPLSYSMFPSYPPAMALFQYLFLVINGQFSEWLMYVAYQVFFISLFMPFLNGLSFKKLYRATLLAILIFAVPIVFFADIFNSIYIDGFLGMLFGFCLASIYLNNNDDVIRDINIILSIIILVLTKEAGIFFALISLLVFFLDKIFLRAPKAMVRLKSNAAILPVIIGILASVATKLSWDLNIQLNNASVAFGAEMGRANFFGIVFGKFRNYGGVYNYKNEVLDKFINALVAPSVQIGPIVFSPIQCMIIMAVAVILSNKMMHHQKQDVHKNRYSVVAATVIISIPLYVIGLLVAYMTKFTEYEAVRLASFSRYLSIIFLMALMFVSLISFHIFVNGKHKRQWAIAFLVIILLITPFPGLKSFLYRENVYASTRTTKPYEYVTTRTFALITEKESRVYVLSQEDKGLDYYILKYLLRPFVVDNLWQWSIGEPFFEGDVWTFQTKSDEFQKILLEKYDYLLIYKTNIYFKENFSALFAKPEEIAAQNLYKVNKQTGLLELVQ